MHIVMVTSSFPRYDGDFFGPWVLEYSKELIRQGNEVTIVAPQSRSHDGPTIDVPGLSLVYFQYFTKGGGQSLVSPPGLVPNLRKNPFLIFTVPFLLFNYYRSVKKIIKTKQVDVLHSQWAIPAGFVNTLLSKKYKIRHVVSTLGAELYLPLKHVFSFVTKYVLKNCDALFAVSEQMKERALRFDINPEKIKVLPNTVDPSRFLNVNPGYLRDQINIHDKRIILTIRRLVHEKRVIDLLQAFHKIDRDDSALVIGGDGPLRGELEDYVAKHNLNNRVFFLGYIDSSDLPKYYADSEIYVLSSEQEGLSISLLESLASGLITVSTDGTGSDDAITHGESGYLYDVADVDGLADRLNSILDDDPANNARISANAQARIAEDFSNQKIVGEWIKEYQG